MAAHFGTYDYTASCGITAKYQTMAHPVCDFAHHMTKVALGGTGIFLSDGATNVMPVPPNRGEKLSKEKLKENMDSVHNAWRIGYGHTMHSLINGFYQGWDLHPAQLVSRYAAIYSFFLEGLPAASERLRNFIDKAARATMRQRARRRSRRRAPSAAPSWRGGYNGWSPPIGRSARR